MESQVGVYIDFDNIVRSRYDEMHGESAWRNDRAGSRTPTPLVRQRLLEARVDLGVLMSFAASFGTVAISRAYADWSTPVSVGYAHDMQRASIDLVQLFPLTGLKNGADIRLAIDVIDDLSQHRHLSHVLVVAGDSDYVSLAQRCRRLGRRVIGVGAARSVGQYWEAACDEFRYYGKLLVVSPPEADRTEVGEEDPGALLVRAARLLHAKTAGDWINAAGVKSLMKRLNPAFDETTGGHLNFTSFLRSREADVLIRATPSGTVLHLRELGPALESPADEQAASSTGEAVSPSNVASPGTQSQSSDVVTQPGRPHVDSNTGPAESVARLRRTLLLPRGGYVTPQLEDLAVDAVRAAWDLCAADRGETFTVLPSAQVTEILQIRGALAESARHATRLSIFSHPFLLRDAEMRLHPNPDLTDADDTRIRSELHAAFINLVRANKDVDGSEPLETVVAAIHGDDLSSDEVAALKHDYEKFYRMPTWRQMAEAIGPMLIPAPVLWDVAAAALALSPDVPLSTPSALRDALIEPLAEMERPLDSVPFDAVYLSFTEAGLVAREGRETRFAVVNPDADTPDIVAPVIKSWVGRCSDAHVPVSAEGLYRLVLPDRYQIVWRNWVRELAPDALV